MNAIRSAGKSKCLLDIEDKNMIIVGCWDGLLEFNFYYPYKQMNDLLFNSFQTLQVKNDVRHILEFNYQNILMNSVQKFVLCLQNEGYISIIDTKDLFVVQNTKLEPGISHLYDAVELNGSAPNTLAVASYNGLHIFNIQKQLDQTFSFVFVQTFLKDKFINKISYIKSKNQILASEWADINKNENEMLTYIIDIKDSDLKQIDILKQEQQMRLNNMQDDDLSSFKCIGFQQFNQIEASKEKIIFRTNYGLYVLICGNEKNEVYKIFQDGSLGEITNFKFVYGHCQSLQIMNSENSSQILTVCQKKVNGYVKDFLILFSVQKSLINAFQSVQQII